MPMPIFGPCYHCGRLHNELYYDYIKRLNRINVLIDDNDEAKNVIIQQFNNLFSLYHNITKPCCLQHIITYV